MENSLVLKRYRDLQRISWEKRSIHEAFEMKDIEKLFSEDFCWFCGKVETKCEIEDSRLLAISMKKENERLSLKVKCLGRGSLNDLELLIYDNRMCKKCYQEFTSLSIKRETSRFINSLED